MLRITKMCFTSSVSRIYLKKSLPVFGGGLGGKNYSYFIFTVSGPVQNQSKFL